MYSVSVNLIQLVPYSILCDETQNPSWCQLEVILFFPTTPPSLQSQIIFSVSSAIWQKILCSPLVTVSTIVNISSSKRQSFFQSTIRPGSFWSYGTQNAPIKAEKWTPKRSFFCRDWYVCISSIFQFLPIPVHPCQPI